MRARIVVSVTPEDRRRLEGVIRDRNNPQKHVAHALALIATAEGCGTDEVIRRSGISKPAVWLWQSRFMDGFVGGVLRDKTRKPGKPALEAATVARMVD